MRVMNETLQGIVSFRGLGFVEIDGLLVPVCGQVQMDLGRGSEVRYVAEQIKRLPDAKPTIKAVIRGLLYSDDEGTPVQYFESADKQLRFLRGDIEGIPLGLWDFGNGSGSYILQCIAPFKLRLPNNNASSTPGGYQRKFDTDAPYWDNYVGGTGSPFTTEIFIP